MAKALADPTRVRILAALLPRELCVCELCDALAVTQSTLSTHLQVVRQAGLVSARKEGRWIYYAIHAQTRELVEGMFQLFRDTLKADRTLSRDTGNLRRRLALRRNGVCCFGTTAKSNGKASRRRRRRGQTL